MAGGISNSLNTMFSRINSIEDTFAQLQNLPSQVQNLQNVQNETQKIETQTNAKIQDFRSIYDEKMKEIGATSETPEEEAAKAIFDELTEEGNIKEARPVDLKPKKTINKISSKLSKEEISEIVDNLASKYDIDSNFIKAIIKQESNFNPYAKSKKGAMGLMQLMPKTAAGLGVKNAFNASENVEGGIKYLKGLMDRFNNSEELALAAYNAGPNAVKRYGGIPPYKETQNYVSAIMNAYNKNRGVEL